MKYRKVQFDSLLGLFIQFTVIAFFIYVAIHVVAPLIGATNENYWVYGVIGLAALCASQVLRFLLEYAKPNNEVKE